MPTAVTYWQLEDDERDFLDFVSSTGNVVAMPDHWISSEDELRPSPLTEFLSRDPAQLLIGLKDQARIAVRQLHEKEGVKYQSLSDMNSCVVNYRRGKL